MIETAEPEKPENTYFQSFKNGTGNGKYSALQELQQNESGYEGYIEVKADGTTVTVTPTAAEGYDFMLLTLVDESGNASTPLTQDYRKNADGTETKIEDGNYSYSFTVDGTQNTVTAGAKMGTVYAEMPVLKVYFDPQGELLNEKLLNGDGDRKFATDANKLSSGKTSPASWLGPVDGKPSSGMLRTGTGSGNADAWDGGDAGNGDYVTYDAGEGHAFRITGASIYSRVHWSEKRFYAVLEGSDDGGSYTEIFKVWGANAKENRAIVRAAMEGDAVTYRYIRIRAAANPTDVSLLKLYGSVVEKEGIKSNTIYQRFRNGKTVGTYDNVEDMTADTAVDYDGYVKVTTTGTAVEITAVANEGFDFMMLNLRDGNGNLTTPLSKDYVKTGVGQNANKKVEGSNYTYTFEVNGEKATATGENDIGTVYSQMPSVEAYFDHRGELINDELLAMGPVDSKQTNTNADEEQNYKRSVIHWIDLGKATLNAGANAWDGGDIGNGDFVTYYAGEGKAFCLTDLVIYSRRNWADRRFTAVVEASNDGDTFTTIFSTENRPESERYSIGRMAKDFSGEDSPELRFRVLRIRATANNTDINLLKLYGTVKEVAENDLSELTGEAAGSLPEWKGTVEIQEVRSEAGFVHPGIGITKSELENVREQVKNGAEPWLGYYTAFAQSAYASRNYSCGNDDGTGKPRDDNYDSQGMKDRAAADAERAFTQAVMYVITGDEVYRSNAMRILRVWEQMDPAKYSYFVDAHIHTGYGLYRMIQAAEIMRYTNCPSEEWAWTDEDTAKFTANVVDPAVNTFMEFNDKFMNQHSFPLYGTLAAAIFKDDRAKYEEKVEWTTVNSTAPDSYRTGSIQWVYRLITTNDATGQPLNPADYHVQHAEMGRDLAHAGDDVGTLIDLARMIDIQGTKVNPVTGAVSADADAVNIYNFLDDRILRATDYFCQYDMGYDVRWTPVRTSNGDEYEPAIIYPIVSDEYRGRMYAVEMADLYYVYVYRLGWTQDRLAEVAPYYLKAFRERCAPTYYAAGSGESTELEKRNSYGAWLHIPSEAGSDDYATEIPEAAQENSKYLFEMERQFSIIDGSNQVVSATDNIASATEGNTGYIRTKATQDNTLFAVYNVSMINRKAQEALVSVRIRTDGNASLEIRKDADSEPFHVLQLPDTKGQWRNVVFDMSYNTVTAGQYPKDTHLMYFSVTGNGTTVDFDHMNVNAGATLSPPVFDNVPDSVMNIAVAAGDLVSYSFSATDAHVLHNGNLKYELQGDALTGAILDAEGSFQWSPTEGQEGSYEVYVIVSDGATCSGVKLRITVGGDRADAVKRLSEGIDWTKEYLSVTVDDFERAKEAVLGLPADASTEEFNQAIN